jgi:pimeloyl-ACP methyl ester carboxylesterase
MSVFAKRTINDIPIFSRTYGKGDHVILFIHGSCMTSACWLPQLENEELVHKYKMIAIDLPGHGQSGKMQNDSQDYSPMLLANLVTHFIAEQKLQSYILVGLSFGTNVIGEIRKPLPGCMGIMLVSPCIVNNEHLPSDFITPRVNGHVIVAPNPSDEDLAGYVFHHTKNKKIAEQYILDYRNTDPRFREQLGKFTMEGAWTDELANIKALSVPVCVIFGKQDLLLKTDYLNDFTPLWNKVHLVSNAEHVVNEDQPDVFNQLLNAFAEDVFK